MGFVAGSFCGYFCECPKCVCIKEGHVGVELPDGTRECMKGECCVCSLSEWESNIFPLYVFLWSCLYASGCGDFSAGNIGPWDSNDADAPTCKVTEQCKSNLKCAPMAPDLRFRCVCAANLMWDPDKEGTGQIVHSSRLVHTSAFLPNWNCCKLEW